MARNLAGRSVPRFGLVSRRAVPDAAVLRDLASGSRALAVDARRYERELEELVRSLDEHLLKEPGIGPVSAAKHVQIK